MVKVDHWPPPDWTEVVILWKEILEPPNLDIVDIMENMEQLPGGRYHLHGYRSTEGFSFRFENSADAMFFKLKYLK